MNAAETCFHCTEKLTTSNTIAGSINDENRYFCCPACQAIAQTIHASGLDDYYCQRASKPQKYKRHNFTLWDNPALQRDFISGEGNTRTAKLYIEGLHCTSCAWLIEKHLEKLPGVISAQLHYQQQFLLVTWDNSVLITSQIMAAIADIGYIPHPYQANVVKDLQQAESRKLLKQIGITGILMMQIGMFSIGIYAGEFVGISAEYKQLLSLFSLIFSIPLLYFSALPFFIAAFIRLKNKKLSIDVSISIAIIGLYSSSVYSVINQTGEFYFDSVAMFCLFILIARYIEKKSRMSLFLPSALLPAFATRIIDNEQQTVTASELQINDIVLVRPGETIAIDGKVISGNSSVSEAFLNGEPKPLAKKKGDPVYAGSTNHDGELLIRVSHELADAFVKKIESLSEQAAQEKPQQQNLTDQIAAKFTAIVYLLAIGTYIFWLSQGNSHAFWIALSVLVISCPCALSLAAPTALSTVQHTLRQRGILVQSSDVIEKLNGITHVIFDKTGTLTEGQYTIAEQRTINPAEAQTCLQIASALEATSQHPIAKAFVEKGLFAESINIHPNHGIEGTVNNTLYRIGKPTFCAQWHANISPPDHEGQWLGLCDQQQFLAWFLVNDRLRPDAAELIRFLKARHLSLEILSGDHSSAVDTIAQQLGINQYQKSCTSGDKLDALKARQAKGERCLMVGDGVNDAPILSQSDVSATLFNACDWVKNSTDLILLDNQLSSITSAFRHAARYKAIVWQNFAWALFYNSVTIPFAMAGLVTPYLAAIGMSLSSIVVVVNSRRLKKRL
jgi:P-type Cu2+ transporter